VPSWRAESRAPSRPRLATDRDADAAHRRRAPPTAPCTRSCTSPSIRTARRRARRRPPPLTAARRRRLSRRLTSPPSFHLQAIEALVACHAENPLAKFWGVCNGQKWALDRCFREEKAIKAAANRAAARAERARFAKRNAAAAEAEPGARGA
jgi:COX assembly protein 2